jgi:hypothetical protein
MRRGMAIIGAMALGMASMVEAASQHTVMRDSDDRMRAAVQHLRHCRWRNAAVCFSRWVRSLLCFCDGFTGGCETTRCSACSFGPGVETSAEYLPGVESYRGGAGN